jgi:protein TonB
MRPLPLVLMSSAAVPIPADHSRWFLRTLLVSLLVHGLVLTTVRSCQKAPPPPALTLSVELRTPPPPPPPPPPEPPKPEPPKLEPRKPVSMPQPARPLAPPPPPTPLLTATPEAPQRVDQPVIRRQLENPTTTAVPPEPSLNLQPTQFSSPVLAQSKPHDGLVDDYRNQFNELVNKNKRYPEILRRMGREGDVSVKISVDLATGKLLDATVVKSSGFEAMDRSALESVKLSVASIPGIKQIQEDRYATESAVAVTKKILSELRLKLSEAKEKLAQEKLIRQNLELESKSLSSGLPKIENELREAYFREKTALLMVNFYTQEESRAENHLSLLVKITEEQNKTNRLEFIQPFRFKLEQR